MAALLAYVTLGQATRKAQVAGVLLPAGGLLQLGTPQPARLQAVKVVEGQRVEFSVMQRDKGLQAEDVIAAAPPRR